MSQYDHIGTRYGGMDDLPCREVENPSLDLALGDVRGLRCLDLASGLGRLSRRLIEKGASEVVGIDISEGMVAAASERVRDWPEAERSKLKFHASDCGRPFTAAEAPFDLVLAGWFLNYASCYEDLVVMFQNIRRNLKPGGRFVGMTVNTHCPMYEPHDHLGLYVEAVETVRDGWKCRLTAKTVEPVSFQMYHLMHDKYERAAAEAGLTPIRWHGYVLPDDERREQGFWDDFMLRPHFNVLSCQRPAE